MTSLRFGVRDLLWAMAVMGLLLALWLWHLKVKALEAEITVFKSVKSPGRVLEYVHTPLNQVIRELELDYGVLIEVDYDSFQDRGLPQFHSHMPITKRFRPGSLHNAIYHIFERTAVITPGPGKFIITALPEDQKPAPAR
jgi:hypothetical protein